MPRIVLCFAVLAILALPCRADETSSTPETLIRLTVSPAPAPKPALRYLLLPELKEMNPGNPIQNYMKCFMEQQKFFFDKEAFERREKLLAMPLKELPAQELQDYGGSPLRQADWAARLDNPDWQILLKLKSRRRQPAAPRRAADAALAKALKVRFRAEVALGRFDDAHPDRQDDVRHVARTWASTRRSSATWSASAIAIAAIGPLEEMLEQPGCPNLYWALTNLPVPLVPLDKGMEGERVVVLAEFRDLDDSAPMSADQLKKFIAHMDEIARMEAGQTQREPRASVGCADQGRERWSAPHAAVSSSTAFPRSGCCGSRPTR